MLALTYFINALAGKPQVHQSLTLLQSIHFALYVLNGALVALHQAPPSHFWEGRPTRAHRHVDSRSRNDLSGVVKADSCEIAVIEDTPGELGEFAMFGMLFKEVEDADNVAMREVKKTVDFEAKLEQDIEFCLQESVIFYMLVLHGSAHNRPHCPMGRLITLNSPSLTLKM